MATEGDRKPEEMTLKDMVEYLNKLSKPVINDRRQTKYCEYISLLLSHFGNERCMMAGSTQECTRLRLREDEGDFDYLIISEIVIPIENIEYREDLPCFVHINGTTLKHKFPTVELVHGQYLPSSLLSSVSPGAFKHLRDIYKVVCKPGSRRGRHTLHVFLDHKIKPGTSLVNYARAECSELGIITNRPNKDEKQIIEQIQKQLQKEPLSVRKRAVHTLATVTDLVHKYKYLNGGFDDPQPNILQTYGSVVHAFDKAGDRLNNTTEQETTSLSSTNPDENTTTDTKQYSGLKLLHVDENVTKDTETKLEDFVLIKYSYKTSKDFIPAFPLSGRLKYMDGWRSRKRTSRWPPDDTIHKICKSEYFVVAKPALFNPNESIDFCLAFNLAEKELAFAMTNVQIKVLLIIKALRKGILLEHSNTLTTFHWKTAVYWTSENVDQSMFIDTEENLLAFLDKVFNYMIFCLKRQYLQHYFVPSNLFAGMDPTTLLEIASKCFEINTDPIYALREFCKRQYMSQEEQELVPRKKVQEFNKMYNDPSEKSTVNDIVSLLRRFLNEDANKFKRALRNVLTEAMPFIVEEEMRGRKNTKITSFVEYLLSFSWFRNVLINIFVIYINFEKRCFVLKSLQIVATCLLCVLIGKLYSIPLFLPFFLIAFVVHRLFF